MTLTAQDLTRLARVRSLARSGAARAARLAAGLSLVEVAEVVGVQPATVSRWERGVRSPHGDAALRYADFIEEVLRR